MNLIERLINYSNDVLDGEIVTCKKHYQAVQRFMDDLYKMQNDLNYPYTFDGYVLEDFYKWATLFKHTKGVLAGQPIELTDFQLFLVANIFCWKKKSTGTLRMRYVYIQLARKNVKSQLLSLIASYKGFLSDEQEEIYIGATNREQSGIVYNEIVSQINAADILKGKYKNSYGKITTLKNGSIIQPLSKEAKKTGDGKNPSLAIIDEYHAHPTDEIYEVMKSGMMARKEPLMVIITTAGFDLGSPCYKEYQYVSKVLDPENTETENEEYFVMICELDEDDDIKDESVWIKANPIVCTYEKGIENLRSDLNVALDFPEKMTAFLTKNMNRWVQNKEGSYMDLAKWNACKPDKKKGEVFPNVHGKKVYIGVDLSATLDLTSVAFIVPIGDGKFATLGHSFMPKERLLAKSKTDNMPYDAYVRAEYLTLTEGDVVDYNYVQKYIDDQVEKYGWKDKTIYYDEWNATQFSNDAMDRGYITVKVVQGMKTLAPATKDYRELVYQKKIIHDDNPLINWAMGNAITKLDHNGNFMLDKSKSTQRIDPVAAIMTAHAHARFHYQYSGYGDYTDDFLDRLGL